MQTLGIGNANNTITIDLKMDFTMDLNMNFAMDLKVRLKIKTAVKITGIKMKVKA